MGTTVFTLGSPGNPDVNVTTSGSIPQTLTTGWTNAVISLTLRSNTPDQMFDDLRLTTSSAGPAPTPTNPPTNTSTPTRTPTNPPTNTSTPTATPTASATSTKTPTATPIGSPPPTNPPTPTPGGEVINPADMATLPAGTNVLLNFDNLSSPADGLPVPSQYAGASWNTLVEGSPWAGDATWNIYITNAGPEGTITFPRPVIVRSVRVSSMGTTVFTLGSPGNPDVNVTTSGSIPQTLTTGWTNAVISLTLRSNTPDQMFDDLRLTTK